MKLVLFVAAGAFGAILGGVSGGVTGLYLPYLYFKLFNPQALRAWGITFFFLTTIKWGIIAGACAGAYVAILVISKWRHKRQI